VTNALYTISAHNRRTHDGADGGVMPGASPPLVSTPMVLISVAKEKPPSNIQTL
jgi:hypothetical protein